MSVHFRGASFIENRVEGDATGMRPQHLDALFRSSTHDIAGDREGKTEAGRTPTIDANEAAGDGHDGAFQAACERNELDLDGLASSLAVAFRYHPHINNVMTHISGGQWRRINDSIRTILDPAAAPAVLPPLAKNIVELMWAEGGVTGRILKPYLRKTLAMELTPGLAESVLGHIASLSSAVEERGAA